jgi:hypothetical protein
MQDTLGIGRESVYHRMRGDTSFTVEELAKMSVALNFSVDELLGKVRNDQRVFFDLTANKQDNLAKMYADMLQQYSSLILQKIKYKNSCLLMAFNVIPSLFLAYFDNLFRYAYYRWTHQESESSLDYGFSEVTLSPDIIGLRNKIRADFKRNNNSTFILDPNAFKNTINGILYYYRRKLISDEELQLLKKELTGLVDLLEKTMQTGVFDTDAHFYFYLSSVCIEANSIYIEYGNHVASLFRIFIANPVIIHNSEICSIHKKYLESMKKYSTFISQSNEILQVKYINRQREYIKNIGNDVPGILP